MRSKEKASKFLLSVLIAGLLCSILSVGIQPAHAGFYAYEVAADWTNNSEYYSCRSEQFSHAGDLSLFITELNAEVYQSISPSVEVDNMDSFTCWIHAITDLFNNYGVTCYVNYTDSSRETIAISGSSSSWVSVNILSSLDSGKSVNAIHFKGAGYNGFVDDVSLMLSAVEQIDNGGFESPTGTSGNRFINSGFEWGEESGWYDYGMDIEETEVYSGSYSAEIYYGARFEQEIAPYILTDDISTFGCYVYCEDARAAQYTLITIEYADGSSDDVPLTGIYGSWSYVDLTGEVTEEQSIERVVCSNYDSGEVHSSYFDEFSLQLTSVTVVTGLGLDNNVFLRTTETTYGETSGYLATFDYGSSSSSVNFSITGEACLLVLDVSLIDEYGDLVAQIIDPEAGDCYIELSETFSGTKMAGFELETDISMNVGLSAMQVKIWSWADDEEDLTLRGTWITEPLQYSGIEASSWVWLLPCTYEDTGSADISFSYGDYQSKAYLNNVLWEDPNEFEQIMGFLLSGNMIEGLFIFPFTYVLHEVFWLLICVGAMLPLYIHHRNVGIVILFFILFGGAGGIMTAFIPAPFVYGGWLFLLLAMGAIFWRVTR
jgi:hypothetical protein